MSNNIHVDEVTWDISERNGSIYRIYDAAQVLQSIMTRLLTVEQEWFMDLTAGLPWFTEMTGRHADIRTIRSYITNEIINTPGVSSLQGLEMDYDIVKRKLDIEFIYTNIYGESVTGSL